MPRKHGARIAAETRKRIARARGIRVGAVTRSMVKGRIPTRMLDIGIASPGEKVKSHGFFGGGESGAPGVEQMLKKLKRLGSRADYPLNKGVSRRVRRMRR